MRNVNPGIHDESAFGLFDRWLAEQEQQASDVAERAPASTTGPAAHLKAVPEPVDESAPEAESPVAESAVSSPATADETSNTAGPQTDSQTNTQAPGKTSAARLPDAEARIEALLKSLGERRADAPREPRQGPPRPAASTGPARQTAPAQATATPPATASRPDAEAPEQEAHEPAADQFEQYDAQVAPPQPEPTADPVETSSTPTRSTSSTTKMLLTRGAAALARRREVRAARTAERLLQEPAAQVPSFPMVVEFAPRKGTQRVLGLLLLMTGTAAGISGWTAYQDQTTVAIGIAGTLTGLTAIIWATRASSVVAKLSVRMGQLEVVSNGALHRFDLTSHYTVVDVVGRPGSGSWKVIFHRRGMGPFVIDSSMVDPHAFMWVFEHYRPDPIDQF